MKRPHNSRRLRNEQLESRLVLNAEFSDLVPLQVHATGEAIYNPVAAVAADLDRDGDEDVAALSETHLSWHENLDGHGTFAEHQRIALLLGGTNADLLATDIDGDGDDDLIVVQGDGLQLFRNLSEAGLVLLVPYLSVPVAGPHGTHAGDLDGDGDGDLLAGSGDGDLLWLENRLAESGDLEFDVRRLIQFGDPQGDATHRILSRPADVDSDGDLDVVFASAATAEVGWLEALNDTGLFAAEPTIISDTAAGVTSMDAADLDGDGHVDVVVATQRGADWFRNLGMERAFAGGETIPSPAESLRAVDLDGDQDADLLVRCGGTCAVWVENVGTPRPFGPVHELETGLSEVTSLTTSDLNGDGRTDVLFSSQDIDRVAWLENDRSPPEFAVSHDVAIGLQLLALVEILDVDGDGDLDLLVMDESLSLYVYEYQASTSSFALPRLHRERLLGPDESTFRAPRLTDLDGDDLEDLVIHTHTGLYRLERITDESLSFAPPRLINTSFSSYTLVDVDGDTDLDVLGFTSNEEFSYALGWYEFDAPGDQFIEHGWIVEGLGQSSAWRVIDMDGDGDLDVFAEGRGSSYSDAVWVENLGGSDHFGLLHEINTPQSIEIDGADAMLRFASARPADIDGDGDQDLAFTGRASVDEPDAGQVRYTYWLENVGTEEFVEHAVFQAAEGGPVPTLAVPSAIDVDDDGDLDLVVGRRSPFGVPSFTAWWLENLDGEGSFSSNVRETVYFPTQVRRALDVDGDGDADEVFARGTTLAVRESMAGGSRAEEPVGTAPFTIREIRTPDFDGDGRPDLLVIGDNANNSFAWARNESPPPFAGDADGNGMVDQSDLDLVLSNWGYNGEALPEGWTGTFNGSPIEQRELDAVLINWGEQATTSPAVVERTAPPDVATALPTRRAEPLHERHVSERHKAILSPAESGARDDVFAALESRIRLTSLRAG